jgi:hypothetical protein
MRRRGRRATALRRASARRSGSAPRARRRTNPRGCGHPLPLACALLSSINRVVGNAQSLQRAREANQRWMEEEYARMEQEAAAQARSAPAAGEVAETRDTVVRVEWKAAAAYTAAALQKLLSSVRVHASRRSLLQRGTRNNRGSICFSFLTVPACMAACAMVVWAGGGAHEPAGEPCLCLFPAPQRRRVCPRRRRRGGEPAAQNHRALRRGRSCSSRDRHHARRRLGSSACAPRNAAGPRGAGPRGANDFWGRFRGLST